MRLIKMFGLASVAAVAAMAFVGASSAMATFDTALCTEASVTLACPDAKLATEVHFVALDPILVTPIGTILCKEALFKGHVEINATTGKRLAPAGASLGITLLELIFTNCEINKTACTVTTTHLGLLNVLKTAANLATVVDSGTGGFIEVKVVCGAVISCTYKGEGLTGHGLSAEAGGKGAVTYTGATVTKASGILCPKEAKLTANYETLVSLWIRS
jgi:hypothetical protein